MLSHPKRRQQLTPLQIWMRGDKRLGSLLRGVIAEFVPKRTLSSIEERGAGISQRPKPILERFGRPDVVAIKTDVFPAEWSDVRQQRVGQNFALDAKLGDGAAEIDGVPEGDGGDREVETRGPIALVFEGAVPDLAVTMEKQARASAFLASPLLSPALERRMSAGSEIQSRMNRVRSRQPTSRSALARAFCLG